MLPFEKTRQVILLAKLFVLACVLLAGLIFFPLQRPQAWLFWSGFGVLALAALCSRRIHSLTSRLTFQRRIRAAIPATGSDQRFLLAVAEAIRNNREERAFFLLEHGQLREPTPKSQHALRWLSALSGVRWLARQRPGRQISGYYQRFPQLYALLFAYPGSHAPLRTPVLSREIDVTTSDELDELALEFITLVDELVASLENSAAPFSDEAQDLLEFMTGQSHVLHAASRHAAWWKATRPIFTRGGGAFLAGFRLMQHQMTDDAARLLSRLADGGMLSSETDTMRRTAVFLSMFSRSHWRMASSDIPGYFANGFYYMAAELGVLRYPTAELPEVISCCRRRKQLQDSKKRMIEDVLQLWERTGDELSAQLSLVLRRLMSHRDLPLPGKLELWQAVWAQQRDNFERPTQLLMDGIAAASKGQFSRAEALFNEAAGQQQGTLPIVNLIYLRLKEKRQKEAQTLVDTLISRYPEDASAMISAGRLLAMYREDTSAAESLFLRALTIKQNDPEDNPVEALICLGEIKMLQGHHLEAQQYFEGARQADPSLPDPRLGLARVHLETRRYERAIEHLKDIVAQPQQQPVEATSLAHYLLYRAYREIGNDRRAFTHLDNVPPPFFKEPDVLDDIASHLESGKQYQRAREFAERAMLLRVHGRGRNDDADLLSAR